MTSERQFDALLRSWLDASAPSDTPRGLLESVVTATAHTRPRPAWLVRLGGEPMPQTGRGDLTRFVPLTLAATAIVVTILIGIALFVRLSPDVGPSPIPGPTHSATREPDATPEPTDPSAAAWTATGSMIEARADYTGTLMKDGKVLVVGGIISSGDAASAELYDPSSGTWSATSKMVTAPSGHTATLLNDGRVLVVGGDSTGAAELYDPPSGTWTATGSMLAGLYGETATLIPDGSVLVAGGTYSSGVPSAELYDPTSGTWTATGEMITPRIGATAALLPDGRVLIAGGASAASGKTYLASAEVYDPARRTWTATGDMAVVRGGFTATLLTDGRVLAVGGYGQSGSGVVQASAELYDPNSGTWSLAGSMSGGRYGHAAMLLRDGRVLVAGGFGERPSSPVASVEVYDPKTGPLVDFGIGSWSVAASMVEARTGATAVLLSNGRVLIAGGFDANETPLATAELYDPGNGS